MLGSPAERRRRVAAFALTLATLALAAPAHAATVTCDKVASPTGSDTAAGTVDAPYRTAQKLADALQAGQTGCLRAGAFIAGDVLTPRHGGTATAPLTIRSYPGETATLQGVVWIPEGSDYVNLTDLHIIGTDNDSDPSTMPVSVQIMGSHATIARDDITNNHTSNCMILGASGWGTPAGTQVYDNVIHDCGPAGNTHDHAIYFNQVAGADVHDNIMYGASGWAVHLYPNAQSVHVYHNVLDGNGAGGVIFAGETTASNNNVIENNVITGSTAGYGVTSWWGGPVGTGNVARNNCLWHNSSGSTSSPSGFSTSGNLTVDPAYLNAASHDYRLASTSPCLTLVGYDIAAALAGATTSTPAPAPTATPTPTPTATSTPAPTPTPTSTPAPTPTADPTTTSTTPAATPTPAPAPANLAPTVSLLAPTAGATFTSLLHMAADATDDQGVTRVEFYVDGVLRGTDTSAPYAYDWSVGKASYGSHTVMARAYDAAGLNTSASVTVRRVRSSTKAVAASVRKPHARHRARARAKAKRAHGARRPR